MSLIHKNEDNATICQVKDVTVEGLRNQYVVNETAQMLNMCPFLHVDSKFKNLDHLFQNVRGKMLQKS